ncbi:MAG TPA: Nramp family divalent metal transporter [Opitutaceae bacterium]|nr:Nramp family divalent metal transporter [Opitutaceae bacterium]
MFVIIDNDPPCLAGPKAPSPAPGRNLSLDAFHGSIKVPPTSARPWRQYLAFAGPALLVSVGYMDPGNWATDLQAGAQFKYTLLWIVGLSSLMAIFLQIISARLGVITGKDLAQCCRDFLPAWTRWPNYLSCEIAIAACDLAEVLGSAVALHLLFPRLSLLTAVIITAFDVLVLLSLQRFGMRLIESVVLVLISTIGICYFIEIFVFPQTQPNFHEMGGWLFAPDLPAFFRNKDLVYLAIGMIGATVMPHNLYLHSALVQSRRLKKDPASIRQAVRYNTIDTTVALTIAFFVNAAILILAAVVFFGHDKVTLSSGQVITFSSDSDWIQVAYVTLAPLVGKIAASLLFAVALLASGQSSTITGTLAGQVVMEGFMHWRIAPWLRRLVTRLCAIIPAIVLIGLRGNNSITDLLTLSQVVLAIQLPFAMFPLLIFAGSKRRMGAGRIGGFLLVMGWASCLVITALDIYGLPGAMHDAVGVFTGH